MSTTSVFRVLVIDDNLAIHADFGKVFGSSSAAAVALDAAAEALFGDAPAQPASTTEFLVDYALQGREGAALIQTALGAGRPYALAFVDMRMPPGWDGLETVQELWKIDPRLQIVVCTAYSDHTWHKIQTVLGATDSLIILKKPFDHIEARQLAHALTRKWKLTRHNEARVAQLDALVQERTRELRIAEERFRRAFDANPVAQSLIALDPFEMLEVNPEFTRQFGFTIADLKHETPESFRRGIDPARWRQLIGRLLAGEEINEHPYHYERSPGDLRDLRCSARLVQVGGRLCSIWLMRDVTEQVRLEQQFRQAQKMEAVGQLAAGLAHDFNNILTVVHTYTGVMLSDPASPPHIKTDLRHVLDASDRAAALTRQLLVFSRRQIAKPEPVNVGAAFQTIRDMLSRLLPERIRLDWRVAPALPRAMADMVNLEQSVMNLVINARDATPRQGVITVAIESAAVTPEMAPRHPKARPGLYLVISVGDTGTGMTPETVARIFEPFFTTKESGKGTGLGLSAVAGIVEQHNGWVEVDSQLGQGTTFKVHIPAIAGGDESTAAPPAVNRDALGVRGQGQRVLLVEDDFNVRNSVARIITRAGYKVTEAEDGHAALGLWRKSGFDFDLVFTDMEMPNGISGAELARQVRRDKPAIKIILASGYSEELMAAAGGGSQEFPLLSKPYTHPAIMAQLRAAFAPAAAVASA